MTLDQKKKIKRKSLKHAISKDSESNISHYLKSQENCFGHIYLCATQKATIKNNYTANDSTMLHCRSWLQKHFLKLNKVHSTVKGTQLQSMSNNFKPFYFHFH